MRVLMDRSSVAFFGLRLGRAEASRRSGTTVSNASYRPAQLRLPGRRGSFIAAALDDSTLYIEEALRGKRRRADFVTPTRRTTIEAARYRLGRRYSAGDLLALGLPARISITDAVALANRGLDELRPAVDSIP